MEKTEYPAAMETVWKIFLKYNAPDYSLEGVNQFRKFLTDENLYKMYLNREYRVFGYYLDEKPEGVVSVRNKNHISLLFVNGKYHHRGIGTALLDHIRIYCSEYEGQTEMTVNSSPYAVEFYRKYGFEIKGPSQMSDGITYTPMKYSIF
ncbi:MAG: GNAT family N-acetyltransferase [Lachnospiraceae bacterium]|nr:GNAT family N-acetyltransferase [Lachnospiraceae bacterium]